MRNYEKFSDDEVQIAKSIDLVGLLSNFGYTPVKTGRNYRLKEHDSFVIFAEKNTFYHYSARQGGSTIDYLELYQNMNFKEAMEFLLDRGNVRHIDRIQPISVVEKEDMILPPRNKEHKRVFAYLNITRGIDKEIISRFMHERRLYESANTHNAVFVSFNSDGKPVYASQRGTSTDISFKGDVKGSDKSFGFPVINKDSEHLIVFEAPIDLMSYMTLYPSSQCNMLALGCLSISSIYRFLDENNQIKSISFVLDNDRYAPEAQLKASSELSQKGYKIIENKLSKMLKKTGTKDVNEYLLYVRRTEGTLHEKKNGR